jgi:cell filamentation protein
MASFIAHENVDYHPLEAMFDKIVQPLPPEQDRRLLPAIDFKPDMHDDSATPNVYQVLSDSEYQQQKQRYSYQTDGFESPKTKEECRRCATRTQTANQKSRKK